MKLIKNTKFQSLLFLSVAIKMCITIYHSSEFTVDTNHYKNEPFYDLLLNLKLEKKLPGNIEVICTAKENNENKFIEKEKFVIGKLVQNFEFSGLNYHFIKFEKIQSFKEYSIGCYKNASSNISKGTKNFFYTEFIHPKKNDVTNVLAFGDWGECELGKSSLDLIRKYKNKTDAIIFLGDLAYDLNDENGQRGNNFMKFIANVTSTTPFQLTPGNHENFNLFEHYYKRFYLPNRTDKKTFYYSYDINDVHFISLNSEVEFDSFFDAEYKTNMIQWLVNDLKSTNKKWRIAYMHRPMYCSMINPDDCIKDSEKLRILFEEIFIEYNVDLVLTGHRHNYERLLPIKNYEVDIESLRNDNNTYFNPKYPVYAVCGATGNNEEMETKIYPPRNYSKIVANTIGICNLIIETDFLKFQHILSNDTIFDEFNLIKNKTGNKINDFITLIVKPTKNDTEVDYIGYAIDIIIFALFCTFLILIVKIFCRNYKEGSLKKFLDDDNIRMMNLISASNM